MAAGMAKGIAAALAGALLWGLSGACAQFALAGYGASALFVTAVRTAIAAALLLAACSLRHPSVLADIVRTRTLWPRLALFGCGLFLSQSTFAASVAFTNAGTATVLQSLATVFVMAIACVCARRLPRALEACALACAMGSTWLVATQGSPASLSLAPEGLAWGLANALAVTLYIMVPKPLYDRWAPVPVIACGMAVAAVVSAAAWACELASGAPGALPALDAAGWVVVVVGIGVLGTACAFGLYLYGVAAVGAVRGSLIGAAEPASATVLAAAWLGTAVSAPDWAGLALMVAAIALVALSGATTRPHA